MLSLRRIILNVGINWIALAATMAISFVLSPFLIHHLGPTVYGAWVLVVSSTTYFNLLDLGLRISIVKFVSQHKTLGDHEQASKIFTGALWVRAVLAGCVIPLGAIIAHFFGSFFKVPAPLLSQAKSAVVIVSVSLALSLFCGLYLGVLAALQRFDRQSAVSIAQASVRAGAIVIVVTHTPSLVALALCELGSTMVAAVLGIVAVRVSYPELRLTAARPSRQTLELIRQYSTWVLVTNIAAYLVYYTDNIVVGSAVSAAAVAFYSIGGTIINYARQIAGSMTATFVPLASTFDAQNDPQNQTTLLFQGTRSVIAICLPICIVLMLQGPRFIGLWIGPDFTKVSGDILRILLLGQIFVLANLTSAGILQGIARHRVLALWAAIDGVSNLLLSIVLVHVLGIYGVAWGTAIPSLMIQCVFWPFYVTRTLNVPLRSYFLLGWGKGALIVIPFAASYAIAAMVWPPHSIATFFRQIAMVSPTWLIPAAYAFRPQWTKAIPEPLVRRLSAIGFSG